RMAKAGGEMSHWPEYDYVIVNQSKDEAFAEARELIDLARSGKLTTIPTHDRPLQEAQASLDALRAGHVVGRTVLAC
ncbi:MAG: hypothetical protein WBD33_18670, partial [Xanthobacteraceae bacterium]